MARQVTSVLAGLCMLAGTGMGETNFELQAVDEEGHCIYPKVDAPPGPDAVVVVEGICLNNPEDMVNPAFQWQIFVQGEGDDLGGTAAWAGKFYQSSIWDQELLRLNASGFREGDRVRVTGYAMSVGGKANINERHSPAPEMDFHVTLLQRGVGLPEPELTTIQVMNTFDPGRLRGGERYQCRRIRIDNVIVKQLLDGQWGRNKDVLIADAADPDNPDAQIILALRNVDFGQRSPVGAFRVIGLGNQEPQFDHGPVPGTGLVDGYQVWVTRADGIIVAGDATEDGRVSIADLAALADNYGLTEGATWSQGDFNGDGKVGVADLGALADNYGYGPGPGPAGGGPAVPEPTTTTLLLAAAAAALSRTGRPRRRHAT